MAGSVTSYETAAGTRYRARWRNAEHQQVQKKGFTTKKAATLFLANVEVSISKGEYVDPAAAKRTVGALAVDWLAKKKAALKPSSYDSLERAWRVHVEPRWADTPLGTITPATVEVWIAEMTAGTSVTNKTAKALKVAVTRKAIPRSATVVYRNLGVLAGILDDAVKNRWLSRNPARGAENLPRKVSNKTRRYLTDAEVIRLAKATGNPTFETLVLTAAYCGLRWSEMVALRVRDVNQLRQRLHVNQAAPEVKGIVVLGKPKNWEIRAVPFPAFLAAPLKALCEDKGLDDLVFADEAGGYLRRPKTSEGTASWFLAALRATKIERLTIHDMRHTAASLAISSGANVKAVQRMLGHKSAAMTLDTYADLFEDDLDEVSTRLNDRAVAAGVAALWAV